MSPSLVVADCPECRGTRTVILGTCEVCFAEFFRHEDVDEDAPPAAADGLSALVGGSPRRGPASS